jgi:hypothetical protein
MPVDDAETHAAYELLRMAGVDNLVDALKNWEGERIAMRALHDQNTALRIWQRRFILVVGFMVQLLDIFEKEGSLFFPLKSQQLMASVRKQIAEMEVGLQKVKLILEEKVEKV